VFLIEKESRALKKEFEKEISGLFKESYLSKSKLVLHQLKWVKNYKIPEVFRK